MRKLKIIFSVFASFWLLSTSTIGHAAFSPLSLSILPPVQFPADDFSITGARLSVIWGKHRDIYGLDLGLVGNITEQDFVGIGVSGIFNWTKGTTTALGLQAAGITNVNTNKTAIYGLQIAGVLNYMTAASSVTGLELALVNIVPNTNIYGLQVGLYNQAQEVYGFQIGIVNEAKSLHGLQIGVLNFNHTGIFSVSPFLNIGF